MKHLNDLQIEVTAAELLTLASGKIFITSEKGIELIDAKYALIEALVGDQYYHMNRAFLQIIHTVHVKAQFKFLQKLNFSSVNTYNWKQFLEKFEKEHGVSFVLNKLTYKLYYDLDNFS